MSRDREILLGNKLTNVRNVHCSLLKSRVRKDTLAVDHGSPSLDLVIDASPLAEVEDEVDLLALVQEWVQATAEPERMASEVVLSSQEMIGAMGPIPVAGPGLWLLEEDTPSSQESLPEGLLRADEVVFTGRDSQLCPNIPILIAFPVQWERLVEPLFTKCVVW